MMITDNLCLPGRKWRSLIDNNIIQMCWGQWKIVTAGDSKEKWGEGTHWALS